MERKDRRALVAAVISAALFIPLGVFGAPALARTAASASQYEYSGSAQYQYRNKVKVCHRTHSKKHPWHWITISASALKAHVKHGDVAGTTCPPTTETTTTATTTTSSSDDDHGNGHGKGKGHGK